MTSQNNATSPETVYGLEGNVEAAGSRKAARGHGHTHEKDDSNDHLALIYDRQDEQFASVVPFIREGLKQNERCLYVVDDNTKAEVLDAFRSGGIDVENALDSGALSIHTKEETYLRTGGFEREAMIEFWEESLDQAQAQNDFDGIRATAEMTWAADGETSLDSLVGYESLLNTVYAGEDYTVLCQYNRNRFPPEVITDVVRTHPLVIYNNTVCRNLYYQPPDEFFGPDGPSSDSTLFEAGTAGNFDTSGDVPLSSGDSASRSVRVLHVDDEPGFADLVSEFLRREGQIGTVVTEISPLEALQRLDEESFDCIVSDYDMPEMDGLELLEAVREDYPDLPFLLFTGRGNEELASEAISAGVTDYFQKQSGTDQYPVLANRITNAAEKYQSKQRAVQVQQRYRRLIEESTDVITVINKENKFKHLSPAAERRLGYPAEALVGANWFDHIHPNDRNRVREQFSQLLDSPARRAVFEFRFEGPDGSWAWFEGRGRNLLDDPAVGGIVVYARDIGTRKRREQKLTDQKNRLEEFASVVSHDLRNPLNIVRGRLELMQEEYDSDHLNDAAAALDRSFGLIDDLLTLAREGEQASDIEAVDFVETCEGCWQNVETADAMLVTESSQMIRADTSRVKQLLENLFRNAIEHAGENVTVTVGDLDNGFYVADDGPGIPEDERDNVFEAGYSTADGGTGIGLQIVQEIADDHRWNVGVTDSETGGARFEITGVEIKSVEEMSNSV